MDVSPSTASAIVAILSSQGCATTNAAVTQLLQPLFSGPVEDNSVDLRPGESYLVMQNCEYSENAGLCGNHDELMDELKQILSQLDSYQDLPDQVRVFITRREVQLETVQTVKIS